MSCLKFYCTNLIDSATLTPSTVNANFPVSNLTDDRRSKVYRSTLNYANIVIDFGSAKSIDSIFVVDNKQTGFGINSLSVDLNSSPSFVSPPFTQSVTLSTQYGLGISNFTTQSYQYARINLASALSYCELSKIFIGQAIDLGRGPSFGWSYQNKDLSTIKENRYGQKFIDTITRQKVINLQLSLLDKTQLDQVFEIYDSKSYTKPFYIELGDDTMSSDHKRYSGLVYFNSVPTITNSHYGRYSLSMNLEEAT